MVYKCVCAYTCVRAHVRVQECMSLCVYMVHVCVYVWVCTHLCHAVWKSEDTFTESGLSFHFYSGSGRPTQVARS